MQKAAKDPQTPDAAQREGLGPLRRAFSRGWRILRTASAFASFGILSLILALFAMPLLRILPGTPRQKEVRCQHGVHWFVRIFMRGMQILRIAHIRAEGREKLREPGQLIVANHPTLLDAILLICFLPQADCVIKGSHFDNAFLGGSARGAGYIPNWDGPSLVADCAERLIEGRSVIIFPEGTRSPVGELGAFGRGAAHIALRSGRDPVPVTIRCDPATLYRGKAWWDVPDRMFTLSLCVGDPLPLKDIVDSSMSRSRAARAVTAKLHDYFDQELTKTG